MTTIAQFSSTDIIQKTLELSDQLGGFDRVDEAHASDPKQLALSTLLSHVCDGWMHNSGATVDRGLRGTALPDLLAHRTENIGHPSTADVLHVLTFRKPAGMETQDLERYIDSMRHYSGYRHVNIEQGANPDEFILSVATTNSLDIIHKASDFPELYNQEPQKGSPDLSWTLGLDKYGAIMHDSWNSEEPHLLIAGSTGSGKSSQLNLLLTQLLKKNTPEDLHVYILEPKNELQRYKNVAHVKIFKDAMSDGTVWQHANRVFDQAVREMERRYSEMAAHPDKPLNLSACRKLVEQDPQANARLKFPTILIVVEECTTYFAKPPLVDYKRDHELMMALAQEIARKSRPAGIHMVFATQNPVAAALPTSIKRQCRRIGLKTSDLMGSRVIIDRPGLENITVPGRGIANLTGEHVEFRSFFQTPQEVSELVGQLPKSDEPNNGSLLPSAN